MRVVTAPIDAWIHRIRAFVRGQSLLGTLESPTRGSTTIDRSLVISGWVFSRRGRIARIEATLGSAQLEPLAYGLPRPDVARIFSGFPDAERSGFLGRVRLEAAISGEHVLRVVATDDDDRSLTFTCSVRIDAPRSRSAADRIKDATSAAADPSFTAEPLPSASLVIPVRGQSQLTDACLRQLQATLPHAADVEIIIVDDASSDGTATMLANWQQREPRLRVLTNPQHAGFGESCNRGARAAHHDVLVFLNNDTQPQVGWLPPLLSGCRDSSVGAVGARLLYPDGRLQEAGGVIFNDATGWNFGKGADDPSHPLFTFVRDVDYCSAAALATPRETFLGAGAFDARFAPAYFEDTDYCFTLRSLGKRVIYQPASVIIHREGATAGNDERTGVKQSQAVNRGTFLEKWREALKDQPPPPANFDRAALYQHVVRRPTRRALVCAPTLPEWDRESGSRRIFDLLMFLRERDWAVTFVADSAAGGDRYIWRLQQAGISVHLDALLDVIAVARFDVALLHFWEIAEQQTQAIRRYSPATRIAVDSVDLHFLRHSRNPTRQSDDANFENEKWREINAYQRADVVLTVSQREASIVDEVCARSGLGRVVPDAESLIASPVPREDRRGLLFLGNFRHQPNIDALKFFIGSILPLLPASLLERHPLSIIGTDLTGAVVEQCGLRQRAGIRMIGWVPEVEPYIERARLMVAPLTYGAGTKRKLIQAAMIGTPSVTTTVGIEGLPLRHREHVMVADDAAAFASAIVQLNEDDRLWERLATAGQQAIRSAHDRNAVRRQFYAVLDELLA